MWVISDKIGGFDLNLFYFILPDHPRRYCIWYWCASCSNIQSQSVSVPSYFSAAFLLPSLTVFLLSLPKVPLLKEQKQRFCGVQHVHRETPVHRERPSFRPASIKLYLVSAAGSGWVRTDGSLFLISREAPVTLLATATGFMPVMVPCLWSISRHETCHCNLWPPYWMNVWITERFYEAQNSFRESPVPPVNYCNVSSHFNFELQFIFDELFFFSCFQW